MAERAGLSQRQFSRRFTREIGSSPGRYVQDLRLEQARLFLTDAEHCHKRVADMIGFRSAEGFRRAFERRFGVTPSAYRDSFSSGSGE
jgi:transcriptional regulator GlxA family with amidase domain